MGGGKGRDCICDISYGKGGCAGYAGEGYCWGEDVGRMEEAD
jgi:hypothetical protein